MSDGRGMDEVFKALADASRRRLLDGLNERNGQSLRELCDGLDMTRQSVSKHLAVLEGAGLVTTVRRGREKLHYLNAAPINAIADRWISRYDRERVRALADLKTALEEEPMSADEFVYTTYIKTTPERLWRALTEPAFTERYWGLSLESDWKPGSPIAWRQAGQTTKDPAQVVLEAEPYTRLSYTWHTFTPEWGEAVGVAADVRERLAAEGRSKVTFEIEPVEEAVRLTVVHDALDAGTSLTTLLGMVKHGWPQVLSGLKTLLETGETLPAP
ncbi:ArsR/SmtB family transcription factor [Actinomadura verrucosospora]|nr:metalloregulator ArsR/SmtB family transcription factor [Actinomadura verrucosospora]